VSQNLINRTKMFQHSTAVQYSKILLVEVEPHRSGPHTENARSPKTN